MSVNFDFNFTFVETMILDDKHDINEHIPKCAVKKSGLPRYDITDWNMRLILVSLTPDTCPGRLFVNMPKILNIIFMLIPKWYTENTTCTTEINTTTTIAKATITKPGGK